MQSKGAMMLTHKNAEKGLKNATTTKYITVFKMFLHWSKKNGHYNGTAHTDFKPKFKGIDGHNREVIYLTWDELIRLYNFEFEEISLSEVRDVFCLCCFTGLRYSDAFNLKKSDIKDGCIHIVTQKTTDGLKIELNKYSRAILEKHKANGQEKALPVITNKKMNEILRKIGKLVGINAPQKVIYFVGNQRHEEVYQKHELLTSHCGRRTFIVNSLCLGIPAEVVMKWTGHSDYDAMKPYIKIVDELKQREMKKFDLK